MNSRRRRNALRSDACGVQRLSLESQEDFVHGKVFLAKHVIKRGRCAHALAPSLPATGTHTWETQE